MHGPHWPCIETVNSPNTNNRRDLNVKYTFLNNQKSDVSVHVSVQAVCYCMQTLFMVVLIALPDGAVAGSHDREVSLVLENSTTIPLHHRLTLQYLLTHLAKVTHAQASNGLDTHTLGKIFGPLLIWTAPSTAW